MRDARKSAGYALLFIAILYTAAPAVAVFARVNLIETVEGNRYSELPEWVGNWEETHLLAWTDKNGDGKVQYRPGPAVSGKAPEFTEERGPEGNLLIKNTDTTSENELFVDKDIMVLANPEIANLPAWVVALVGAGGLAAALSTAAGLLLVISTSISHDLLKKQLMPDISERGELLAARFSAFIAVTVAGYFGINPPDYVAAVVALAFGLAAASFFPAIILGIFSKKMNKEGAIAGMIVGLGSTIFYILKFKFGLFGGGGAEDYWFGISPEGFGTIGMILNFVTAFAVKSFTKPTPDEVQELVENIRIPAGEGEAHAH